MFLKIHFKEDCMMQSITNLGTTRKERYDASIKKVEVSKTTRYYIKPESNLDRKNI
jgi:hypothetical protein